MAQFLISVFHEPGVQAQGAAYADEAAMAEAFAKVGAFNERLQAEGRFVLAGGLNAPEEGVVVDPSGTTAPGPIDPTATLVMGGFWIVQADDVAAATELTVEGAAACGQRLELRQIMG